MTGNFRGTVQTDAIATRYMWMAWLILVISLGLTAWAWLSVKANVEQNARREFDHRVQDIVHLISVRLDNYESLLRAGAVLFAASLKVTREEWRDYVREMRVTQDFPGVFRLTFAKHATSAEMDALIQQVRAEGLSDFILRPAGKRTEYVINLYVEPSTEDNRRALGFDHLSVPERRIALEQARDRGMPVVSGKTSLLRENEKDRAAGFLMYVPIYRNGMPTETVAQRRAALSGYVTSPIRGHDLMQDILDPYKSGVGLDVFDGTGISAASLLYEGMKTEGREGESRSPVFSATTVIDIGGHVWTLRFYSQQEFEATIDSDKPRLVLIAGAFISLLFFAFAWSLVSRKMSVMVINEELMAEITERQAAEAQMRQLSSVVEQTADSVVITDSNGIIRYVNPAFEQNTGYSSAEAIGRKPSIVKSGQHNQAFYRRVWETIIRGQPFHEIFTNRRKDGSLYYEEKTITPLKDANGDIVSYVSTGKDITGRREAEERLHHLAHHDSLTNLPNRNLLQDRLQQAMREAESRERLVAVLFLDLDRFKTINDTLGHEVGDALLKAVADRMATCLRPGDTISRVGGDEFTVILAGVAHVDDVSRVAQEILGEFIAPFRIGGRDLFVTASIGITLYPLDEQESSNLLKDADIAMYHAKESGGNQFQFYAPELNARAERHLELETGLRQALEREEFVLYYQPLVDVKTGRVTGMEALLRWDHPKFGLVPPLEFIPLAEDTGLIVPIGEWVLKTACAQIKAWHDTGFPALQVAVNLSSKQLRDSKLIDVVKQALAEAGIEARYLDLELTESVLMQDMKLAVTILKELKTVGVSFSLDDFGTGYSSLSYLKHFPIDYLKIDRSFINDITTDPFGAGIVRAIIIMAHTLNIKVVAEGVESHDQLAFLRAEGCDLTQGYYCSKPLSAQTFTELLQDWNEIRAGKCSRD